MNKPGVMMYFDLMSVLDRLSDKDAGILFRAIMRYGIDGTISDLPNAVFPLWPLIQSRLDSDDNRYYVTAYKRKYGAYVRWCRNKGEPVKSYDEWLQTESLDDPRNPMQYLDAPDAYA